MTNQNIILFVNSVSHEVVDSIRSYERRERTKFRIAVIRDNRKKDWTDVAKKIGVDIFLLCDFKSHVKITKTLLPYHNDIIAATSRSEENVPYFMKVIPHLPYLKTPTAESLKWSTDKLMMREMFSAYDETITPKFTMVADTSSETLKKIKERVGFPLVVKPANLAVSLLVSICYHEEELAETLKKVFRKVCRVYAENRRKDEPKLLAEQFMDGDMYSVDLYVNSRGKVYFCPMVYVKTGRLVGFDDFFGYFQLTPTLLKDKSIEAARRAAVKSIRALGLRSSTAHVELMRLEDHWKVIEVGPRIGGFRSMMYELSYGIDHSMNDILIRMGKKPIISDKVKGYTAVLKLFAREEGILSELKGVKKLKELESIKGIQLNKKIGDRCHFAKNGGKSVCNVILFNKDRSKLLADVRRVEQNFIIKTN